MREIKAVVLDIVRGHVGRCEDNEYRARVAFSRMDRAALDSEYGESDRTPRQILAEYEEACREAKLALEWVKSHLE